MTDSLATPERLEALRRTGLMDTAAEEAFDRFTRLATRLLEVPVGLVSLVDDRRQFFKSAVGLELSGTPLSHSFCQHVVRDGRPLVVTDAREDPCLADNLAIPDLGVVAYAGVPLTDADGVTLGSFCAIDTAPHTWSEEDVALLTDLAAMVMAEIALRASNHRLQIAEREAAARAGHLESVIDAMSDGYALIAGGRIVDVNRALVELTGFTREQLIGCRPPFPYQVLEPASARAERGDGTYETLFQRADGSRFPGEVTTRAARRPDGGLLGLIHTMRDISDRRRREEELRRLASRDALTGLLNRRAFHERLLGEIARAHRHDHAFSLAVLDVDHFKAINDRHGHPVGDTVLREVAERLSALARDGDCVARIGGEEFAWLLPDARDAGAIAAAERARAAMAGRPFPGVGRVTVSVGVCELVADGTAEELYRCADEALYAAKQAGRNRTVAYDCAPAALAPAALAPPA